MSATSPFQGLTPGEPETPSPCRPRTQGCAAPDFDSPENEASHEAPENELEPWLLAWLATGHENRRDVK
ncbi:hypothetical protein [Streptomyces shenzhenensis]|uniref:hypothetical protein n=1 Tax=Streptomyces shenzhenensis TaxID=943815 RepID=UPI001C6926D9|nr:hypothetical protein [Streptomyces shenzhenensis]